MRAINNLKREDSPIIEKIFKIFGNENPNVSENFFASTVFSTDANFLLLQKSIGDELVGRVGKPMVETPLTYERMNQSLLYTSSKEKGMAFGIIFIDYRKKNPLLAIVVDKSTDGYSYQSTRFENGSWSNGLSETFDANTVREFIDGIVVNLDIDVKYFTDKY